MSRVRLTNSVLGLILVVTASIAHTIEKPLLVVTEPWPPYVFDKNSDLKGLDVDTMIATFKQMNIPVNLEIYPWQRCLAMIRHKMADAILSTAKTSERQQHMYFPGEPVSKGNTVFFIKKGNSIPYQSIHDLDHLRAGAVTGYKYCDEIDSARFTINAERVPSIEQNFIKLLAGRLDFSIGEQSVGFHKAKMMGLANEIDIIPSAFHCPEGNFLAFSKKEGNDRIASEFSKAVRQFKKTKQYLEILQRYGMEK